MNERLVLLHGFTGSPESFSELHEYLPRARETVVPPLIGHGAHAPGVDTFEGEVERLWSVVGSDRIAILGYSMGARLGLGMLAARPERVHRALFVGLNPGLEVASDRALRRAEDERLALLLETDGIEAFVRTWEDLPLFGTQRALARQTLERQRAARLRHDPLGLARALRAVGLGAMPSLAGTVREFQSSIGLVVGALDAKFRAIAERFQAPRVIEGVGHNVVLEAPRELAALVESV